MDSTYVSCLLNNGHSPILDALHSYQLNKHSMSSSELETLYMQIEDVADQRRFDKRLVELGFPAVTATAAHANVYIPQNLCVPVLKYSSRKMAYQEDLFWLAPPDSSSTVGCLC